MDESSAARFEDLQKPLQQFRAKPTRLKVHPLESAVVWVVCIQLVFQPWAIGGMRPWSQFIGLALSVVGFVLALLPRNYTEEQTGSNRFRLIMWPKLAGFPLFWAGLALLGLVLIHALNPSWKYNANSVVWWIERVPHVAWLPTGVDVPFVRWGPWRLLLIYGSIWLTVCAIWVGFVRRRSLQIMVTTLAFNGLALVVLGLVQKFAGNGKIFWFYASENPSFFASFVYKNHGGAYLDLVLAATCGLAAWYYLRGLRRLEKSNPGGVFAFLATCIGVGVLTSGARGATLVMLVFLLVCVAAFVVHQFSPSNAHRKPIVALVLILVFGYFLKTGLEAVQSQEAWQRIQMGVTRKDDSLASRELATKAALEMLRDTWPAGVGAGGFRFVFPNYQQRHLELMKPSQYWEHAHNDVVEFPIEFGLAGMLLIGIGGVFLATALVRSYFWENPLSLALVFGCALLVVYGWWDFPFQNPAVLITWCALLVTAAMWAKFEESNAKG